MTTIKPPNPPYVGPAAHDSGPGNKPIHRIVFHCTVSPCEKGGARATAAFFRTQGASGSAHYVVDPDEVVQVVFDDVIAWHAPPNANSLGIEMCDSLVSEAWDEKNKARWHDPNHTAMLQRAAELGARLALAYGVPIVKLSSADLLAGKHGICGHVDVTHAWHESTHWDPGMEFPWDVFMPMLHAEAKKLRDGTTKPTPKPKPVALHSTTIGVTTSNIRGDVGHPLLHGTRGQVRRRIRRAMKFPGFNFGQEIDPGNTFVTGGDYPDVWVNQSKKADKRAFATGHETPVSVPARAHGVESRYVHVHRGKAHVSPARGYTVVTCEVDGYDLALINCHPLSKPRPDAKDATWRIEHYDLYLRKVAAEAAALAGSGHVVIVGGDMNHRLPLPIKVPAARVLVSSGLDHLWVLCPEGVTVGKVTAKKVGRTIAMDHPILHAELTIETP